MLGIASPWLGQSLVVFDVLFLVVGLPSIVFARLGFQDLVFGVLTSMLSFIARGRLHSLLISFRLSFPLYSRISLQLSSHLWWLSLSPCLPLEGIPKIKDSEDIPKKHFLGLFVGISSDISDGTVLGNIPREKRYRNIPTAEPEYSDEPRPSEYSEKPLPSEYSKEVYPSGYSEEICPRNIPRKLSSEYPEGYTSSEYSQK
ncbi:hypothetical protein F2Q69_00011911 [Brassica cretica]|uniref:Uncharacterized protein n=1 Tax=Brassica cretica TaxID=69181 RepID=A0A8S9QNW9_BRACR|nr:hypothetical protein F2Q69_00011911 [Brassica cretica]